MIKSCRSLRALTLVGFFTCAASAQTNLVSTNPSFEDGLNGWAFGASTTGAAYLGTGTCGFNGVLAPGTEALTTTAGVPATDGTHTALGSVSRTGGGGVVNPRYICVLYQDVAIPAGVTKVKLTADLGLKLLNGNGRNNTGIQTGLYSIGSVPDDLSGRVAAVLSGIDYYQTPGITDAALQPFSVTLNTTSVAGTTVRLALLLTTTTTTGGAVAMVDNVRLYAFPAITGIAPSTGPSAGGTSVVITGIAFSGATAVTFGGTAATSFTVDSDTQITAVSPARSVGVSDIVVTAAGGVSTAVAADRFTYTAPVATPTLGEWAMIALTILIGGLGYWLLRRRAGALHTS